MSVITRNAEDVPLLRSSLMSRERVSGDGGVIKERTEKEGEGWGGGGQGCLTVLRLQSVGMCVCVAGVTGAALEAVVVLLVFIVVLAIADAVYAVHLARSELHALDVHLCTNTTRRVTHGTKTGRGGLFPPTCPTWSLELGSC